MTSILTNAGALTTLALMRSISASLEDTQDAAATGFRIRRASDNAAYWSIATTLRSDMQGLGAVADALNLSKSLVDTAYSGVTAIVGLLSQVRDKVILALDANESGRAQLQIEIRALQETYVGIAMGASFAGENWLCRDSLTQQTTVSLVTGVARDANGAFSVQSTKLNLGQVMMIDTGPTNATLGVLTRSYTASGGTAYVYQRNGYVRNFGNGMVGVNHSRSIQPATITSTLTAQVAIMNMMLRDAEDVAALLGTLGSGIDRQHEFVTRLGEVHKMSLGKLVDADVGETSSKLRALQARQELAIQGLGIANAKPALVLQLFR